MIDIGKILREIIWNMFALLRSRLFQLVVAHIIFNTILIYLAS
jgi:hypothetical protein